MRIKLTGEVVKVEEHRKYITVEIEEERFEDSINILVYSPLREKLKGMAAGDLLKVTGFKVSRKYKRSYEPKKVKFIKVKPNILMIKNKHLIIKQSILDDLSESETEQLVRI